MNRSYNWTVKIVNKETCEILEAGYNTFSDARRTANIAFFAAGYDEDIMEISIICVPTGEIITDW